MFQTKLIRILRVLKYDEVKQLEQLVNTALFNDGSRPHKTRALFNVLVKFHPEFDSKSIEKSKVFYKIFPGEEFNSSKLDKVTTELVSVVRKFIFLHCSYTNSGHDFWLSQVRFFRERKLDSEFRYVVEQSEKMQSETEFRDNEYFLRQFAIESEKFKHFVTLGDKKADINLAVTIKQLDLYYVITKLEYNSYLLVQSKLRYLGSLQSLEMLEEVLRIAKNNFMDVPMIAAYYCAYELWFRRGQNLDEYYQRLKIVLKENGGALTPGAFKTIHNCMRSYQTFKYNQGDTNSLKELFELFKSHISQGTCYQFENNILAETTQNAITVALKLGETDWALNFLEEHRHRIVGADDPEAIYEFNLANCHFHKGEYAVVEHCLANYNYKEMFYKLAARRMEIKLYYETSSPLLDARLAAFKIFVHEQKTILPPDKIAPNNHFADLMRQIIAPKTLGNTTRVKKLMAKLVEQKAVAEREWLQQKLEELL
ncbi:MAG: hypothetical protein IT258_19810 [Saprospiraceae bacterium]|nr:hypothetical protein [Saprospiraceae bacterium]